MPVVLRYTESRKSSPKLIFFFARQLLETFGCSWRSFSKLNSQVYLRLIIQTDFGKQGIFEFWRNRFQFFGFSI